MPKVKNDIELRLHPVQSTWRRQGPRVVYEHQFELRHPRNIEDRYGFDGTITMTSPDPINPSIVLLATLHLERD